MIELLTFLAVVAVLTTIGLLALDVLVDGEVDRRPTPPPSHPEDEFARGAHHRDPTR